MVKLLPLPVRVRWSTQDVVALGRIGPRVGTESKTEIIPGVRVTSTVRIIIRTIGRLPLGA